MESPSTLYRLATQVEANEALDGPAAVLASVGRPLAGPRARAVLGGRWLGHALHPLLTDVPLGTWMSASFLDVAGGRRSRDAARKLVAAGVVASVPTIAAGLSDWMVANREERRVGVVHAATNTVALGCYAASLVARRRGRHGRGVVLGLLGATTASVGGFFGGHLALARDTSLRASRSARESPAPPVTAGTAADGAPAETDGGVDPAVTRA